MAPETATLIAAGIAAVAAVVAAVMSSVSARAARRATQQSMGRDQWWTRFSWAMDKCLSADPKEVALGLATINELLDAEWVTADDKRMAAALAGTIEATAREGRWPGEVRSMTERSADGVQTIIALAGQVRAKALGDL